MCGFIQIRISRHSSFSFFLFEIKFRDPRAQITRHFSLVNIIHLSKASCSGRVNQKRRQFKKYEQSHSSYTLPEPTWNISSACIDLWECRPFLISPLGDQPWCETINFFPLISYWLQSGACKIKRNAATHLLKFFQTPGLDLARVMWVSFLCHPEDIDSPLTPAYNWPPSTQTILCVARYEKNTDVNSLYTIHQQ